MYGHIGHIWPYTVIDGKIIFIYGDDIAIHGYIRARTSSGWKAANHVLGYLKCFLKLPKHLLHGRRLIESNICYPTMDPVQPLLGSYENLGK